MSALATLVENVEEADQRRKSLKEERSKSEKELRGILKTESGEDREVTADEEARAKELLAEIDAKDAEIKTVRKEQKKLDRRLEEQKDEEKRARRIAEARGLILPNDGTDVRVTGEDMVYGPDSPFSWVNDFIRYQGGPQWPDHDAAGQRLAEWGHQVEREIALNDKSQESRGALKQIREHLRPLGPRVEEAMKEVRERGRLAMENKAEMRTGITTGGGATATGSSNASSFVTPVFFVNKYAPYREFGRAFADQLNKQTLPPYGMNVYIPHVTRGVKVEEQTEASSVAEQTPEAGYLSGGLKTLAGEVRVTQQLLDRAGPNFSFDQLIFDQLNRRYALELDTYALKEVLAVATSQEWTGNSGAFELFAKEKSGGFYGQVSKAKAKIRTEAGTVLNPNCLFMRADRWEYIAAWTDAYGRNVVVPGYGAPSNAEAAGNASGDVGIEGDTGYRFNGLRAFTDQNIPTKGTTGRDQAIVGALEWVYLYEGQLVPRVIPQTYAAELETLLQVYAYVTEIVLYEKAIVAINGTGMHTIEYEH